VLVALGWLVTPGPRRIRLPGRAAAAGRTAAGAAAGSPL
jgi:hypothetical protein